MNLSVIPVQNVKQPSLHLQAEADAGATKRVAHARLSKQAAAAGQVHMPEDSSQDAAAAHSHDVDDALDRPQLASATISAAESQRPASAGAKVGAALNDVSSERAAVNKQLDHAKEVRSGDDHIARRYNLI